MKKILCLCQVQRRWWHTIWNKHQY